MARYKILLFLFTAFLFSCNLFKQKTNTKETKKEDIVQLPDSVVLSADNPPYRGSEIIENDIIHTKLEVKFDWNKSELKGLAIITFHPYFYPTSKIVLDAKGFQINEVALLNKSNDKKKLVYEYDSLKLAVQLDKQYTSKDTLKIFVDYVARPNDLKLGGSFAIKSNKGLYFINPLGKEKNKPTQIWTQGETQSNSSWFPTNDRPNEKMTQEIYITVDKKYKTLSNGDLVFSLENADTTRTDYWKMDMPHSPYLVMMAIGDFSITKEQWRGKEVSYYLEKKYEHFAKDIFGNTPEMMEFFSNKLGVSFPWNKYAQIVVRDYVSGAMENTTATVHGEFVQKTKRELIDKNEEDVISHELFHQWFGDMVTCESWSNIPLNESFATYGEYLWREYKYGLDDADSHLKDDLDKYLREADRKQENPIRYYYNDREDLFDAHTYEKGGRILHMLRKHVGDDAFFKALKLYLENNKFSNVEVAQLRLAFEKVTGEDLNWFFNQWFFSSGYPDLNISYSFNDSLKKQFIYISQKQNLKSTPLFKLPILIAIYYDGKVESHQVTINKNRQVFEFDVPKKPDLVNVDAQKMLLCTKNDHKNIEEWAFQYLHAPLFTDRRESVSALAYYLDDSLSQSIISKAMNDPSPNIKIFALQKLAKTKKEVFKNLILTLAKNDKNSIVRSSAINALGKYYKGEELIETYKSGMKDSSYSVISESLEALAGESSKEALKYAFLFEKEDDENLNWAIANVYSQYGNKENNLFFIKFSDAISGYNKISFISYYNKFLKKNFSDEIINSALPVFEKLAKSSDNKIIKYYCVQSLYNLVKIYVDKESNLKIKIEEMKKNNTSVMELESELKNYSDQKDKIIILVESINKE